MAKKRTKQERLLRDIERQDKKVEQGLDNAQRKSAREDRSQPGSLVEQSSAQSTARALPPRRTSASVNGLSVEVPAGDKVELRTRMSTNPAKQEKNERHSEATRHVEEAHKLLRRLRDRFDEESPELDLAITKLEAALNILTIKTSGLL